MAQLLLRLKDNPRAVFNTKRRGDVVAIKEDGYEFSKMEKLPYFLIVKIADDDVADFMEFHMIEVVREITIPKTDWLEDKLNLPDIGRLVLPYMGFVYKPQSTDLGNGDVKLTGLMEDTYERKSRIDIDKALAEKEASIDGLIESTEFVEITLSTDCIVAVDHE